VHNLARNSHFLPPLQTNLFLLLLLLTQTRTVRIESKCERSDWNSEIIDSERTGLLGRSRIPQQSENRAGLVASDPRSRFLVGLDLLQGWELYFCAHYSRSCVLVQRSRFVFWSEFSRSGLRDCEFFGFFEINLIRRVKRSDQFCESGKLILWRILLPVLINK
jgi:hypothetical protein